MKSRPHRETIKSKNSHDEIVKVNGHYIFSQDYVDFLNKSGWRLEKKLPSNNNNYSDLLEDTEWRYINFEKNGSKHYRRDLDALS